MGGFKWVKNLSKFTPKNVDDFVKNSKKRFLLDVDIKYPPSLHNDHNNLPFMPEKMEIDGLETLIPNLSNKHCYVIHIRARDQALKHGIILEFDQSAWLRPYIDFNTKLRT